MRKVTIISPRWPTESFWGKMPFQFPLLALTTVAALTPETYEVALLDENIEPIDFNKPVDIVGITAMTPLVNRAYEIADMYRERGVTTVIGGFHPTWCPDEAATHADVVVQGEAEGLWEQVLYDFEQGKVKARYCSEARANLSQSPTPRYDLLEKKKYFFRKTMQLTRGCPFDCDFCSVTSFFGRTYRCKPIDKAITELESLTKGEGFLLFVDDNIAGNRAYAKQLLTRLGAYRLKWVSHATLDVAEDDEMLRLLQRSGCIGLFIGFESVSQMTLDGMGKRTNDPHRYAELIRKLHDKGIGIEGAFILGRDEDDDSVFDKTLEFIYRNKIDGVHLSINTPFPGTRLHKKLESESRIIDRNWNKYDLSYVVFQPAQMSAEKLQEEFYRCYKEIYSLRSIWHRLVLPRRSIQIFGPLNWGIRRACRKAGYF